MQRRVFFFFFFFFFFFVGFGTIQTEQAPLPPKPYAKYYFRLLLYVRGSRVEKFNGSQQIKKAQALHYGQAVL